MSDQGRVQTSGGAGEIVLQGQVGPPSVLGPDSPIRVTGCSAGLVSAAPESSICVLYTLHLMLTFYW